MTAPQQPGPPRKPLFVGEVLGAVLLGIAWWRSSREELLDDQVPWIVLGIVGGIVCIGVAALWVLELRRAVSLRTASVRYRMTTLAVPTPVAAGRVRAHDLVAIATRGARQFHEPDCHLVAHRTALLHGSREDHVAAGRVACRVCADD